MITATTVIDQITILEDGVIQVRKTKRAFDDDGSLLGERHHRYVLEPGDDVSTQPQRLQRITQAVWTANVISDYQAAKAARSAAAGLL
jgi:predicted metal-dependent HD superfamily phosphohydrolase